MLEFFRSLVSTPKRAADPQAVARHVPVPTTEVTASGSPGFPLSTHLSHHNGFPYLDWAAAQTWVDGLGDPTLQADAWARCELAWLEHLQASLGPAYQLRQEGGAVLLSTLEPHVARAMLDYMGKTLQRIVRLLDGVAQAPAWGKDLLIVFDDEETYYRYVSHYYPEAGEFAGSSGMYINAGCGHFVTAKADMRLIEPIIAHELTHSCVSHLPIPAWLNEGLAVNTEHRLSPPGPGLLTPQQMHDKHQGFWGAAEIQEFWSGKSFLRNDDGNMLSYDLARIVVAQLGADWERFRSFVLAADLGDAGAAAAEEHLGMALGAVVCALLEREADPAWMPNPGKWHAAPEHGAF
ncbi:hypothetical protein HZ993_06290 [Rhodoferax sp. AJA081-3]|uniref:hypothetical protein n=1 Tax=Rhodoferax sp. AJA081-3 TaxID=2752316 RepID=UPI001AE01637|nr:hypothetical protein [Rhodoferax sp. AJA081-3]QTN29427.1 hypothetical protein HZ993_06290 [Rhodoferax sp. AJA081-3]